MRGVHLCVNVMLQLEWSCDVLFPALCCSRLPATIWACATIWSAFSSRSSCIQTCCTDSMAVAVMVSDGPASMRWWVVAQDMAACVLNLQLLAQQPMADTVGSAVKCRLFLSWRAACLGSARQVNPHVLMLHTAAVTYWLLPVSPGLTFFVLRCGVLGS